MPAPIRRLSGFGGIKGSPKPYKVAFVEGADSVRQELREGLETIATDGQRNISFLPYALLVTTKDGVDIHPVGLNRRTFAERRRDADQSARLPSKTLPEYAPRGAGLVIGDHLEGFLFYDDEGRDGINVAVLGTHYGPDMGERRSPSSNMTLSINKYGGRPSVKSGLRYRISQADQFGQLQLVTLGPGDDISGIVNGGYQFTNWFVKKMRP